MLISDLHIGCAQERLDALNQTYEYCIKNGINIIINAGDLINGRKIGPYSKNKIDNYEDQIKYLLKNYPFDKNILNFTCLGNHDIDALQKEGINLATVLHNNRHDIIPLGYAEGIIGIKGEKIVVRHPISVCNNEEIKPYFVIKGHSHKMSVDKGPESFSITVPNLSDLSFPHSCFAPSAVEMTIKFSNNLFSYVYLKQLVFINNDLYTINECGIFLNRKKIICNNELDNDTNTKSMNTEDKSTDEKGRINNKVTRDNNPNSSPKMKKLEKFRDKYHW